jgi:oligopeptide/dipeptide ABC transporter ATP-binding protein
LGMAIMIITHNMGVIAEVADRVLVMYAGRIVEQSPAADLFDAPRHPYTKGLLACVPTLQQDRHRLIAIPGSLPEPARRPSGCRFAPRCTYRIEACRTAIPPLVMQRDDRAVACIRADELVAS